MRDPDSRHEHDPCSFFLVLTAALAGLVVAAWAQRAADGGGRAYPLQGSVHKDTPNQPDCRKFSADRVNDYANPAENLRADSRKRNAALRAVNLGKDRGEKEEAAAMAASSFLLPR